MKYTKNFTLKLKNIDFTSSNSFKDENEDYQDFTKDSIQVTVDHQAKAITTRVIAQNQIFDEHTPVTGVRTLHELNVLHRLIHGVNKVKINNEEGCQNGKETIEA